ncbi:MAG: AAA family ATPase [Planctomycetota bacterium]
MECVVFIGLQASGKSSFYFDRFADTHVRLNMDMLRTRHRETVLFDACLAAKQPVVIDNTNPTRAERQRYLAAARQQRFSTAGYFFDVDVDACLLRNEERSESTRVPRVGLLGTLKRLERPSMDEGFDALHLVRLTEQGFSVGPFGQETPT